MPIKPKDLKKMGNHPLGGTIFSQGIWTHPVRIHPNPEPIRWKLLKKQGFDDHICLAEGKTEAECIEAFLAKKGLKESQEMPKS